MLIKKIDFCNSKVNKTFELIFSINNLTTYNFNLLHKLLLNNSLKMIFLFIDK